MPRRGEENGRRPGRARATGELEAEVKRLQRENGRLKKRLRRYEEADFDDTDDDDDAPKVVLPPPPPQKKCPTCGSTDVLELQTPTRVLFGCKVCRQRI